MGLKDSDYKSFLENVDGIVVVNNHGIILFMEDNLAKSCYVDGEQMNADKVIGRNIYDIIPTTNIMKCFEEKKTKVGDYYFVEGRTIVSTRKPIYENGKIVAAIEYDLFGIEGEFLSEFLNKTEEISKEISKLQKVNQIISHSKYTINEILGHSEVINQTREEILVASRYNSTVLIEGESGSGKELIAHAIHALSDRQLAKFVRINCAAIPDTLVESELFGYDDGSFTGGKKGGKKGKFEIANGGTLFLDEINQLPLSAQPKLLRALQEHEINPVGSEKNIPIDVRIIATSNEDLKVMVEEGRFRRDLYYRLNVINIKAPSLDERKEDIIDIAENLIEKLNERFGKSIKGISPEALKLLESYHWQGNVRELYNVIERAMNSCNESILKPIHFNNYFIQNCNNGKPDARTDNSLEECTTVDEILTLEEARISAERKAIINALIKCNGSKVAAAKFLKISRSLIHKKIVAYSIKEREYFL